MYKPVSLSLRADFESILSSYRISEHAHQVLRETKLVLLVGLAGGGRNTLINKLVHTGKYHFLVSDTTRPPKLRDGKMEENGVQYFFRSEEDILADLKAGEFVEAEVIHGQQVSGISVRELVKANKAGKIVINEVEIGGAQNVLKLKPDTVVIFVLPPDFDTWQHRFLSRETISDTEYKNRLITAERNIEVGLSSPNFSFVINDNLEEASEVIDNIARSGRDNKEHDSLARKVARDILGKLKREVAN
jgi:guanylate kinase